MLHDLWLLKNIIHLWYTVTPRLTCTSFDKTTIQNDRQFAGDIFRWIFLFGDLGHHRGHYDITVMDGNKLALDYSLCISSTFQITCIAFAQLLPRCTALFHMIINPFDRYHATDYILSTMVNIPWLETPPVHYPKIYTFWHRNIIASLQENFDTNDYVWPKWLWCSRNIF